MSFGLVVALVIHAFGSTSGAHINPAVTVALSATRRFSLDDAPRGYQEFDQWAARKCVLDPNGMVGASA